MAIMTKEQYQASIRARGPMNVWFLGEKIEDLTTIMPMKSSPAGVLKMQLLLPKKLLIKF